MIAGYQVQNVGVEVHFGKYHAVDSSEAAFKTAGSMAFRNVFQEAKPALLEPIVTLHVTVPSNKLGDINSDMSGRRGRVLGMDSAGGDLQTVTAEVPLAEVTTYARSLSSMTGGQGSYTMDFSHYDVVPGNVQKKIVEKAVMRRKRRRNSTPEPRLCTRQPSKGVGFRRISSTLLHARPTNRPRTVDFAGFDA